MGPKAKIGIKGMQMSLMPAKLRFGVLQVLVAVQAPRQLKAPSTLSFSLYRRWGMGRLFRRGGRGFGGGVVRPCTVSSSFYSPHLCVWFLLLGLSRLSFSFSSFSSLHSSSSSLTHSLNHSLSSSSSSSSSSLTHSSFTAHSLTQSYALRHSLTPTVYIIRPPGLQTRLNVLHRPRARRRLAGHQFPEDCKRD